MGQTIVHKYASGERKNLCFVLQTAERGGEYQPVVIPLKFTAVIGSFLMVGFQSETFGR
jgi:hypothetical protein